MPARGSQQAIVQARSWRAGEADRSLPEGCLFRLGSLRFAHPQHCGEVIRLPGSNHIMTVGGDSIRIFDRASGSLLSLLQLRADVTARALSPDGRALAFSPKQEGGHLWSIDAGRFRRFGSTDGAIQSLAFSPDGALLAAGTYQGAVDIFTLPSLERIDGFRACEHPVDSLAFSPDSRRLAASATLVIPVPDGSQASIAIWDVAASKRIHDLQFAGEWFDIFFSPDGRYLSDRVYSYEAIDTHSGEMVVNPHGAPERNPSLDELRQDPDADPIDRMALSPDGRHLATAGGLWTLESQQFTPFPDPVRGIAGLAFQGTRLLRVRSDGLVDVFDPPSGTERRQAVELGTGTLAAVFSSAGDLMAAAGERGEHPPVRVFRVADWNELCRFRVGQGRGQLPCFSGDGRRLVVADQLGVVEEWDIEGGRRISRAKTGFPGLPRCLALCSDEKTAALGVWDCPKILLWDRAARSERGWLVTQDTCPLSLAFHTIGRKLAAGCRDWTVRFFDLDSGEELRRLKGHTGAVTSLVFSNDGSRLYSGSRDSTVLAWDAQGV
ncbi:MAG: WD40 repeat domain-containing protein [Deltaproteobacteria bacterium]|nr:WD40 repeat domain-containing protein [Deltaproteobacteria bacterium]